MKHDFRGTIRCRSVHGHYACRVGARQHARSVDAALSSAASLRLIRVCREGEAWAVVHGLFMGGRAARAYSVHRAVRLGDLLRCAIYDFGVPLFAVIGYRSYLMAGSTDSARTFTEPILKPGTFPTA